MDITLVLGYLFYTAISVTPIHPPPSILGNVEFAPFQKVWGSNLPFDISLCNKDTLKQPLSLKIQMQY